jgi:Rrf2 family protein
MKFSTRGKYGTRMLLDLALHHGEVPVSLKDIARRQQIPLSYTKRLIGPLIAGGLVQSTRGVKGGVLLAKSSDQIKLKEVIGLLEGQIALVKCVNNPGVCDRSQFCVTRDIWTDLGKAMDGILESTTLRDLVERYRMKERSESIMYYI